MDFRSEKITISKFNFAKKVELHYLSSSRFRLSGAIGDVNMYENGTIVSAGFQLEIELFRFGFIFVESYSSGELFSFVVPN